MQAHMDVGTLISDHRYINWLHNAHLHIIAILVMNGEPIMKYFICGVHQTQKNLECKILIHPN